MIASFEETKKRVSGAAGQNFLNKNETKTLVPKARTPQNKAKQHSESPQVLAPGRDKLSAQHLPLIPVEAATCVAASA